MGTQYLERRIKVLNYIQNNPDKWDQRLLKRVNQKGCLAAITQVLSGYDENYRRALENAADYLGFNLQESVYYFSSKRTFAELNTMLQPFYDSDGYGQDGFNRRGQTRQAKYTKFKRDYARTNRNIYRFR